MCPQATWPRVREEPLDDARSDGVVTLSSRGSPSTTAIRPPERSTSDAQSVAPARSPASARRSDGARNACGVWAATRPSRSTVSATSPRSTRFSVSETGSAGTAPSTPSASGPSTRSTTSSSRSGRAASCTSTTSASSGTSASAARADSARVAPPVTQENTFAAASSSASRMLGSSQPGGAASTIASTHGQWSSRSRLSASSGRPRSSANAFGRSIPKRSPEPAASSSAQVAPASPEPPPIARSESARRGFSSAR